MKMKEIRSRGARIPSTPLNSHCHEDPTGTVSDQIRPTLSISKYLILWGLILRMKLLPFSIIVSSVT